MSHVKLISKTCDRYILQFFLGTAGRCWSGSRMGSIGKTKKMINYSVKRRLYHDFELIKQFLC